MTRTLLAILLSLILVGCATARYDEPRAILKIDDSTYTIRYAGMNESTTKLKIYLTVKAAELTIRDKYSYFELFNEKNKTVMTRDFGSVDSYEADVKMYKNKPINLPGIYNAVEVIKNLGSKITETDLKDQSYKILPENK
jgi:hypothetical protein